MKTAGRRPLKHNNSPELLAPAGDFEALKAAISQGADAVYFGSGSFNARRHAANFAGSQLQEAVDYAHMAGVRAYLTLNTLIADEEGPAALELAGQAFAAGIDALIIQDIGLASLLRRLLPDLPLFASTQMTLGDDSALRAAARLGLKRVILPRELSLEEIGNLTDAAAGMGLETEVFIHGALCIGYSGQCLLSSLIGGRSGNRGECAQPCRLPWRISNAPAGADVGEDPATPRLSPSDQALPEYLQRLTAAGVSSFKIEGRMRTAGYVGQVTAVYRQLLDQAMPADSSQPALPVDIGQLEEPRRRLLLAFNRGGAFTDRYISGRRQADFLSGSYTGSYGLFLGKVQACDPIRGTLQIETRPGLPDAWLPARGDIISVRQAAASEEKASAPLGEVSLGAGRLTVKGFHPDALRKLVIGDLVFRMTDQRADKAVQQAAPSKTAINLALRQENGEVWLQASAGSREGSGPGLTLVASCPAESIEPLLPARIEEQLKKTGNTPFLVTGVEQATPVNLGIASLNDLRRRLLADLAEKLPGTWRREWPASFTTSWPTAIEATFPLPAAKSPSGYDGGLEPGTVPVSAYYHRLPANPEHAACGADRYYLPIMDLTRESAEAYCRSLRAGGSCEILAWMPAAASGSAARQQNEIIRKLAQWGFDGLCAGNPGLDLLEPRETRVKAESGEVQQPMTTSLSDEKGRLLYEADSGANIFNQAALLYYQNIGAAAAAPSLELSSRRLQPLLEQAARTGLPLEIPLYGRIRLMTSAFCPIGQNLPGCRRCMRNDDPPGRPGSGISYLKDRLQQAFPLLTHPGACYTEIFSHFLYAVPREWLDLRANSGANDPDRQAGAGPNLRARLYFLEETATERQTLIQLARHLPTDNTGLFEQAARKIASRLGCAIGQGHMNRDI